MACFCLMTENDFATMEMMNRASQREHPAFEKVRYINQTTRGMLTIIEGKTKAESADVAHSLRKFFPDTRFLKETPQSHHIIPQQFKDYCRDLNIKVDDYTVLIDAQTHREIHKDGYNAVWGVVIEESKGLDKDQAYNIVGQFAGQLVTAFGWGVSGIQEHRTHLK